MWVWIMKNIQQDWKSSEINMTCKGHASSPTRNHCQVFLQMPNPAIFSTSLHCISPMKSVLDFVEYIPWVSLLSQEGKEEEETEGSTWIFNEY
jgi:hypothetical protein